MIHIDGHNFKDTHGRTLMLRGVNLGGSTKVPTRPNGATHLSEGFFNHRDVSFVGRPFPLEEADEHFSRLREWGLTCLRFLVTWEAIEHAGPGIYDEEYLDYLVAVVKKAGEYGFTLFIDPHQDVWSRFSGGDGAPGWTLEAVGFDITNFEATGAAIVHQTHGDPLPRMIWPTNNSKLAAATMFALFFGGNDFAPRTTIGGDPVQEYLQRHYVNALKQVAVRLKGLDFVLGYDVMNEPSRGYIGWKDLTESDASVAIGCVPTPLQSMLLGTGIPQEVEYWEVRRFAPRVVERRLIDPRGSSAWRKGFDPVWQQNGVWELDANNEARLLRPSHFCRVGGKAVDFQRDYYVPFVQRYAEAIHSVDPDAMIFMNPEPMSAPPVWKPGPAARIVYEPHWYDGIVLFMKRFNPWMGLDLGTRKIILGQRRIRRSFAAQLAAKKRHCEQHLGGLPTLVGEIGIAYDLNDKQAYRTGDFTAQIKALDRSLRAIEDNLLHCTIWNYTADNDNNRGDQWNDEDLSIFSRDQQADPEDINSGGRALEAVVRPYPRATCGEPLRLSFDVKRRVFEYEFRHDPAVEVPTGAVEAPTGAVEAPTEIFVPNYQYPDGYEVEVSDGTYETDRENQRLIYRHSTDLDTHRIRIMP
ncbi:MAG: cellulase family glycosylhydrolase [Anaerolineae bacterium]|nr:cellulase family glycosylhydrolase [Anaerolineae bacterium]